MSIASPAFGRTRDVAIVLPLWPALFGTTILAALGLRLWALDATPLSPDEAARAIEALAIWRSAPADYAAGPLLSNLLAVWFALFTPADGPARTPGALAGWAVTLTPLLFRSRLGWPATVGASALLAISPLEVLASRSTHPAAFVTLASGLTVGCLLQAFERGDSRGLLGSAVAVGVGTGSSPVFVGQLLAIAVAFAACPPLTVTGRLDLKLWAPRAVALGLAAALLADTLLLTRPGGLQAGLVDAIPAWFASLGLSRSTVLSSGLLGAHEMPLLALAAYGLVRLWRDSLARFLAAWALASMTLAMLTRQPDLGAFAAPTIPLALLGGLGLARLDWLFRRQRPAIWLVAGITLAPLVYTALRVNSGVSQSGSLSNAHFAIGAAGLLALVLLASTWLRISELGRSFGLSLALGLLLLEITSLSRLNYAGFEGGGPALLAASSRPEIRLVETQARDWWRQDPSEPIRVDASLRPVLEWSLRDGPPVEWISMPPATPDRSILGAQTAAGRPPADWLRLVAAERYGPPSAVPGLPAIWRWLVQRQPFVRSEPYAILMAH